MESSLNKFLLESIENYHSDLCACVYLKEKIDWQRLDAQKWLSAISASNDEKNEYLNDLTPKRLKAFQMLPKLAKNVRIEKGHYLTSLFLNIDVIRDHVVTEVIDGKKFDDFSCNPYDMDYGISPDKISKALKEAEAMEHPDTKIKPQKLAFSFTTHNAALLPACMNCEGRGFLRCDKCEGSGREQYVDGYYAGGEERIKTGQCSNCFGTGKIQCGECTGTGKIQLTSNHYQIVKSFEDIKKMKGYFLHTDSWDDDYSSCFSDKFCDDWPDKENYDDEIESDKISMAEYVNDLRKVKNNRKKWLFFNDNDLKSGINKLYKNQKEILIDGELFRNGTLPDKIPQTLENLYEQNKNKALEYFESKTTNQGKLACFVEKHLVIPVFRIIFDVKNYDENVIYVFELPEETICSMEYVTLPELSFFKSLFV